MRSNIAVFLGTLNVGTSEFSNTFTIAINSEISLLPNFKNSLVKSIDVQISSSQESTVINFYDFRFQGLNRDGSIITQNAGIILNPVSGSWGSAFVKDTTLDFVLSSKRNQIIFTEGILLGGVRLSSYSVKFKNPLTVNTTIRAYLSINYE